MTNKIKWWTFFLWNSYYLFSLSRKNIKSHSNMVISFKIGVNSFFLSGFSDTDENLDIYLQLYTWDGLSHIFSCNTCISQTATWWDLPRYRITITHDSRGREGTIYSTLPLPPAYEHSTSKITTKFVHDTFSIWTDISDALRYLVLFTICTIKKTWNVK